MNVSENTEFRRNSVTLIETVISAASDIIIMGGSWWGCDSIFDVSIKLSISVYKFAVSESLSWFNFQIVVSDDYQAKIAVFDTISLATICTRWFSPCLKFGSPIIYEFREKDLNRNSNLQICILDLFNEIEIVNLHRLDCWEFLVRKTFANHKDNLFFELQS